MVLTSYISYCSIGNKGYTIEILKGTEQEIVDVIRDRRQSYGAVEIHYEDLGQGSISVLITYFIPT